MLQTGNFEGGSSGISGQSDHRGEKTSASSGINNPERRPRSSNGTQVVADVEHLLALRGATGAAVQRILGTAPENKR